MVFVRFSVIITVIRCERGRVPSVVLLFYGTTSVRLCIYTSTFYPPCGLRLRFMHTEACCFRTTLWLPSSRFALALSIRYQHRCLLAALFFLFPRDLSFSFLLAPFLFLGVLVFHEDLRCELATASDAIGSTRQEARKEPTKRENSSLARHTVYIALP